MAFTVFSTINTQLLSPADAWSGVAGTLSAAVLSPVLVGVSILVFWHGFNILRGAHGAHHFLDIFAKLIRSFLVVALAISAGAYAENVSGFFIDLRNGLTGLFIPGGPASSYIALDNAMTAAISTWDQMWLVASQNISFGILGTTDLTGVLMVGGWIVLVAVLGIFCALCAFNLIFIDFSLALMLALGPMFIACMAFNATSRFADGWIAGVLKYILTAVCVSAVVGIGISIVTTYTSKMIANPTTINFVLVAINAVIATTVLGLFVSKMPQVASDMVGGAALNLLTPRDGALAAMKVLNVPRDGQSSTNGGMERALERQFGPPTVGGAMNVGGAPGTGNITGGRESLGAQAATAPSSMPPAAAASVAAAMASSATSDASFASNAILGSEAATASSSPSLALSGGQVISASMPSGFSAPTARLVPASNDTNNPAQIVDSATVTAPWVAQTSVVAPTFAVAPAPMSTSAAAAPSFAPAAPRPPSADFSAAVTDVAFGRPVGSTHTPGKA